MSRYLGCELVPKLIVFHHGVEDYVLRDFYQRLRPAGKPAKVALTEAKKFNLDLEDSRFAAFRLSP